MAEIANKFLLRARTWRVLRAFDSIEETRFAPAPYIMSASAPLAGEA